MRAIFLLLFFLSWGTSLAQAAECPMGAPPAASGVDGEHAAGPHGHHGAPQEEEGRTPARHLAECGVGMPCGVPAIAAVETILPRATLAEAHATVRATRAYASPDLAAEPPPPRLAPRF